MRKMIAPASAIALALAAGAATAGEWTDTITNIDPIGRIVVSNDTNQERVFAVSDSNTVGPELDELEEGDKVSIFYADSEDDTGQPINATTIEKVDETHDATTTDDEAD
jgi:hypothetical protein